MSAGLLETVASQPAPAPAPEASGALETQRARFEWLLGLADDRLILGHRLSEWCGHAPILEEELALANIALDLIGQAQMLFELAAETEGAGRSADALAFLRDSRDFRNMLLVEQPNGDFAFTIVRQFLFDAWDLPQLEALCASRYKDLAGFAAKACKEARYHLRHSHGWLLRLGGGTQESNRRTQAALDELWRFTPELFLTPVLPSMSSTSDASEAHFQETVRAALSEADLTLPDAAPFPALRGRAGLHSEHLGHLLAEMQVLQRSYPGAKW